MIYRNKLAFRCVTRYKPFTSIDIPEQCIFHLPAVTTMRSCCQIGTPWVDCWPPHSAAIFNFLSTSLEGFSGSNLKNKM